MSGLARRPVWRGEKAAKPVTAAADAENSLPESLPLVNPVPWTGTSLSDITLTAADDTNPLPLLSVNVPSSIYSLRSAIPDTLVSGTLCNSLRLSVSIGTNALIRAPLKSPSICATTLTLST